MRRPFRPDYDTIVRKERAKAWLADRTLYGLCRDYPGHTERAHIHAKIWLIGRAMATGIERQVKIKRDRTRTGMALDKLENFIKGNCKVEEIFANLRRIAGTLDEDKLDKIVCCHGRFVKDLAAQMRKSSAGRVVTVTTFAAKYMHFHNRLVPIYDNDTKKKLTKLYPLKNSGNSEMPKNLLGDYEDFRDSMSKKSRNSKTPKNADKDYFRFVKGLQLLASELGLTLEGRRVRDLDHYLRKFKL